MLKTNVEPIKYALSRKAVISLAVMEEKKVDPEEIVGEDVVDEDLEEREQNIPFPGKLNCNGPTLILAERVNFFSRDRFDFM